MTKNSPPIAITMGDPAGVGPEIVVKAVATFGSAFLCVVIGDPVVIQDAINRFESKLIMEIVRSPETIKLSDNTLYVLPSSSLEAPPEHGKVCHISGHVAHLAIKKGIELSLNGEVSSLVTAPINKESLKLAGITFPGHTEMLAEYSGANDVSMMLSNDEIRTVLVTVHCSLREAIDKVDLEAQRKAISHAHRACVSLGIKQPRIAVSGLNPHAGENGLFGDEEELFIKPAIQAAREQGMIVFGPLPGDTVFMQARAGKFDVVVAQYHDQGLIPVKYMGLEHGVNTTLGLPFARTSPDHGTAFDIAGKGIANPSSLISAIRFAQQLTQ